MNLFEFFAKKEKERKIGIYSIFDRIAKEYSPPFTSPNDASARRSFSNSILKGKNEEGIKPADYELYRLGYYSPYKEERDQPITTLGLAVYIVSGELAESLTEITEVHDAE